MRSSGSGGGSSSNNTVTDDSETSDTSDNSETIDSESDDAAVTNEEEVNEEETNEEEDPTELLESNFSDNFEADFVFDAQTAWKAKQLVNGTVERVIDPTNAGNTVAEAVAGAISGSTVGKADLIKKYEPIAVGSVINIEADFYFPAGSAMDKIHLMDIECDSCGVDNTPGVRLYVRNGELEIDRGKIGYNGDFTNGGPLTLTTDTWYTIGVGMIVGEGNAGPTVVEVNGQTLFDEAGTNIISQSVLDQYGLTLAAQHIDSIQVGLTANANSTDETLYFDNVSLEIN